MEAVLGLLDEQHAGLLAVGEREVGGEQHGAVRGVGAGDRGERLAGAGEHELEGLFAGLGGAQGDAAEGRDRGVEVALELDDRGAVGAGDQAVEYGDEVVAGGGEHGVGLRDGGGAQGVGVEAVAAEVGNPWWNKIRELCS